MGDQDNNSCIPGTSLAYITADDMPALITVHTAAFKSDQFSNLMLLDRDKNAHQTLMQMSIEFWMSDPAAQLIRAVDVNGELVGWACWVLKGMDNEKLGDTGGSPSTLKSESESIPPSAGGIRPTEEGLGKNNAITPEEETIKQQNTTQDPAQVLGRLMHEDSVQSENEHMNGKKYMVLQALVTDPRYQGQGIGTKLVQWGIDRADAEGLPSWIHASPSSYRLYERAGFQEVGRSDYDLDHWAPGGKGGNRGWGRYTFKYMLRQTKGPAQGT